MEDLEGEKPKKRFQMSVVWWGLVAIVIVGGLGTFIYLNSLQDDWRDFTSDIGESEEEQPTGNTNISPLVVDTDNDGLIDAREEFYGTDPKHPDSDGDGFSDGFEVLNGYNPMGEGKLKTYGNANTNQSMGNN